MQTVPAPSRARILGSLKNSFASAGATSTSISMPQPVVTVQPISEVVLSNDQKMEVWESILNEVEGQQPVDAIPPAMPVQPVVLQTPSAVTYSEPVPVAVDAPSTTDVVNQPLVAATQADDSLSQAAPTSSQFPDQPQEPLSPEPISHIPSSEMGALGQLATAIDPDQTQTLNPPLPTVTSRKESIGANTFAVEAGATGGQVEVEPQKEISPEVESFIQKVEEQDQAPQEIVIADGNVTLSPVQYPAQPVLVLPITPELEEEAAQKNVSFSLRWLKEWCHKLIKMFAGKVIYRQEQ